jgi:hypothetical protein
VPNPEDLDPPQSPKRSEALAGQVGIGIPLHIRLRRLVTSTRLKGLSESATLPTPAHARDDELSEHLGGDGALRPLPRVAPPELPLLLRRAPPRPRPGPGRRRADLDPGAQGEDRDVLSGVLRRLHRRRDRQLRAHPHDRHPARPRQVQHAGERVVA